MKIRDFIFAGIASVVMGGASFAAGELTNADASKTVAAKTYVDGAFKVIDDAKFDVSQGDDAANQVVITDDNGNVKTGKIEIDMLNAPASCINGAALCVLAFTADGWQIVDVTADPTANLGPSE